jgi:hypothetical protein
MRPGTPSSAPSTRELTPRHGRPKRAQTWECYFAGNIDAFNACAAFDVYHALGNFLKHDDCADFIEIYRAHLPHGRQGLHERLEEHGAKSAGRGDPHFL